MAIYTRDEHGLLHPTTPPPSDEEYAAICKEFDDENDRCKGLDKVDTIVQFNWTIASRWLGAVNHRAGWARYQEEKQKLIASKTEAAQ